MMSITEHYGDDTKLNEERIAQRKRAIRLRERYERNKEVLMLAENYEELEHQKAIAKYQMKRAKIKLKNNKDDFLYLI